MTSVPLRPDRRNATVARRAVQRTASDVLWAERLAQLGSVATSRLPDPLEVLRTACRATGAAAAEMVIFDGRASRWSTDPLRSLAPVNEPLPAPVLEVPLEFDGESIGALRLASFPEEFVDPLVARLAAQFVAMAMGSVNLGIRLATELDEHAHDVTHDPLTGLSNRAAFEQAVDSALTNVAASLATTTPQAAALLVVDINRFKEVNTSFGHEVGDAVIAEVGSRLVRHLGVDQHAARTGGDEFSVLLSSVVDLDDASRQAARLLHVLTRPVDTGEALLHIDAAMGLAVAPFHANTRSLLIRRADVAMDIAKERPESALSVWEPGQERVTQDQLELVVDLREAIESGTLDVHYQPKADINSGDVVGVEALVRWNHPLRGSISPEVLVPLAEHTGLIHDLTWFVLHTALSHCAEWHRSGIALQMSVNLPARSLRDPDLPEDVANALSAAGVGGEWLTLEITETGFTEDNETSRYVLAEIRNLGVHLSIDDFGTGYSALGYLSRIDVSELKIDKSFVIDMHRNPANLAIVRAVIDVADSFGLATVAEGVEHQEVLERLAELGCTQAQGFHVSRPLAAPEFRTWLAERRRHSQSVSGSSTGVGSAARNDGNAPPGPPKLTTVTS
jgi:diguanylate cyclase